MQHGGEPAFIAHVVRDAFEFAKSLETGEVFPSVFDCFLFNVEGASVLQRSLLECIIGACTAFASKRKTCRMASSETTYKSFFFLPDDDDGGVSSFGLNLENDRTKDDC